MGTVTVDGDGYVPIIFVSKTLRGTRVPHRLLCSSTSCITLVDCCISSQYSIGCQDTDQTCTTVQY